MQIIYSYSHEKSGYTVYVIGTQGIPVPFNDFHVRIR